jgi:tetratricopeptide (TPR) repeat protein
MRTIAEALDVDHVLEGSVRKSGNQVRITAQLIDVSTDTHLWSEAYDRQLEDIFAVQDEIAGHIVEALKLTLDLEAKRPPTVDLEAYTLFLQGRELLRQRDPAGLLEADALLAQATERDPEFADAWAARAQVQVVLPGYVKEDISNYEAATWDYAKRALARDPDNADALLALGQISNIRGDHAQALARLEDVINGHPNHSTGQLWLAIALLKAGYAREAYDHIQAALRSDPVHATVLDWYGRIAQMAGRPARVVEAGERALQLGRPQGRVALHQHFLDVGGSDDMAPYVEDQDEFTWGWLLRVYAVRDNPDLLPEALAWADEAQGQGAGFIAEYMRVNFLMVAGTPEAFFEQVRKIQAVDDTVATLVWTNASSRHRQSSAMTDWAREMNFVALWAERGWPDLCRPVGDDDFECD